MFSARTGSECAFGPYSSSAVRCFTSGKLSVLTGSIPSEYNTQNKRDYPELFYFLYAPTRVIFLFLNFCTSGAHCAIFVSLPIFFISSLSLVRYENIMTRSKPTLHFFFHRQLAQFGVSYSSNNYRKGSRWKIYSHGCAYTRRTVRWFIMAAYVPAIYGFVRMFYEPSFANISKEFNG